MKRQPKTTDDHDEKSMMITQNMYRCDREELSVFRATLNSYECPKKRLYRDWSLVCKFAACKFLQVWWHLRGDSESRRSNIWWNRVHVMSVPS